MHIDISKNTEADLQIPGNILHVGFNFTIYKTPQGISSQETKQNLLISTNETSYDCKFGTLPDYHCGIQFSHAIFLPSNIPGILHFHQINTSYIAVIPPGQHCLHIIQRIFDKLTTKGIHVIGSCYSRGNRDGSNPLFYSPSQSLSDNRNREILYVIDQHNREIRMVNIADRMVGTLELQLHFEASYWHMAMKYWQITQAENATFYIAVGAVSSPSTTYIMSLDLIPLKNASSEYYLTLNRLSFDTQDANFFFSNYPEIFFFSNYSEMRQMTWISNHTLMIMDELTTFNHTEVSKLPKFLNFSAESRGYININNPLLASSAIDRNLSRYYLEYPILYTWFNDSIYITSSATTYRLTRQEFQFVISNEDHHTGFNWQTSKYLWRMKGAEGKEEKLSARTYFQHTPFLISQAHIPKALSDNSRS